MRDEKSKSRYAGIIRQYIAITGLNLEQFNTAIEGLGRVHRYFEDLLPNYKLEPLQPLTINGILALACCTRYFIACRHCKSADSCPFELGVDPNGDLQWLAGNSYIHTEDNAVQYLGKKNSEKNLVKYVFV